MALIVIAQRMSGENDCSNYKVTVRINEREIDSLLIRGHNRDDGWAELVKKIAEQRIAKP